MIHCWGGSRPLTRDGGQVSVIVAEHQFAHRRHVRLEVVQPLAAERGVDLDRVGLADGGEQVAAAREAQDARALDVQLRQQVQVVLRPRAACGGVGTYVVAMRVC